MSSMSVVYSWACRFSGYALLLSLCLFFLGFITERAEAQDQDATVRVIAISAEDGLSVIGANVIMRVPEGDTLHTGVTNVDGLVEFSRVEPGSYELLISYVGYETNRSTITLEPGETRVIRPELQIATFEIGEVVVGVKRGAVRREAGRQTITVEDIQLVPAPGPGGDLSMYLQTLPGVVTPGDKGGEVYVRGGTPSQNLILVDNMPVVKPFHISNLFSAFPQEVINSVDIYAGGFGAEYIGATSSVLDVSLRQGNMKQFQSNVSASPYMVSLQAEGPLSVDNTSVLFIGRQSAIEETAPSLTGEEVPLRFGDMLGRLSFNWPGFSCNFTGLYTFDQGQINPQRDLKLEWNNTAVGVRCLGYGEQLSHTLDITLGYTGYNSSETGIDNIGRKSDVSKGFLRLDNGGEILGMMMEYGFRWNVSFYKANLDDPFPDLSGADVRYPDLDSNFDVVESVFNGYATLDWTPSDNLTISPGIASQNRHSDMLVTFEPRLRITWLPDGTERQEINIAGGRYVQLHEGITDERDAGTVFYVYKPVDSDEPLPEAWHGILGYRRQFSDAFEASVEGYVKKQNNLRVSEWTREPGNTIRTALAEGFTYGADIRLEVNKYPFYLSLGYGYSEVTYTADSDDLVAWLDRPEFSFNPSHDLRHQLTAIASYDFLGFTANASWRFSSGAPYTQIFAFDLALQNLPDQNPIEDRGTAQSLYSEPFDNRLPSFHRLDLSLSRSFDLTSSFSIETEVGAINSYDSRNVFYYDVNTFEQIDQTPLLPYASISASFN